ncbi:hypothetical protein LY90DRAFT_511089 [Neocallimastix californiae]|uniref:MULE transposase domain-containing protein n=1 Tax=Neocallimastix californiae TaxID=1754190 RepID=A0A1Y2BSX1_9FUNG|nr:hypothetical protein LY90DRAFT_511089 [Neocallimastix californiae]|eukprot:ORY37860.1 hypothetical protein LY90DRAFT_511089 [Neocallimastix californiae]
MDIKPKHIFNAVSQEMGLICPEYSTIRSQIIRNINKQFPTNIKSFDDIPIESEYYKTKRNENFMIFKNTDLIIFQSPFQAYLFSNYHKNIFADCTFYAASKFSYQLFITRTYVMEFNMFYTTSISILKNKKQSTYETLFKEIKKNVNKFRSNTLITTINFHCDFEQEHLTNNASESYNSYLNNIFPNKPLFYKLIYILKKEENLSYNDYQRRTKGNWKKKQKIFSATDEIKILIENYKNKRYYN